MTGVFLSTLDSGMVNIALPTIMRSFQVNFEHAELIVGLYLLTITVTLVFWGRLADTFGRGNMYVSGMLIFGLGAAACYMSGSFVTLLFCRVIQALGASMMMSSGPAIIRQSFPKANLGRSLGLVGVATACGLLTGPFVSGLILTHFSWKAIFVVPLPVCILALFFAKIFILDVLNRGEKQPPEKFDWLGSCCWAILVILVVGFTHRLDQLFTSTGLLLVFAIALLLVFFISIERRADRPILPIALLEERYYWVAVVTSTISFAVLFTVLVLIPFYLEYVLLTPVNKVGAIMMAVPATLIIVSPVSGWLYDRIGARLLTTAGLGISCCALLSLVTLGADSSYVSIAVRLAVLGAGQSVFLSPNSASVLSRVDEVQLGTTSGILATARNFGMVLGATVAAALFSFWFGHFSGGRALTEYALADSGNLILALRSSLAVAAVFALLGVFLSSRRMA